MSNIDNTKIEPTNVTKITVFTVYKKNGESKIYDKLMSTGNHTMLSQKH